MIVLRNGGIAMTEHEFAQRSKLQNLLFHQRSQNLYFFKKTYENT